MNKKIPKVIIADGVVTNRKDLCLGILTADCAPIVVFGKKNFGIVHVGWKGAFSDIIKNTVKTFISKGETNDDLNFFIVLSASLFASLLVYFFSNLIGNLSQKHGIPFVVFLRTA